MAKYSIYGMAGIGIAAAIGLILVLGSVSPPNMPTLKSVSTIQDSATKQNQANVQNSTTGETLIGSSQGLKKFSSINELDTFLANVEASRIQVGVLSDRNVAPMAPIAGGQASSVGSAPAASNLAKSNVIGSATPSFSTTNIQVAGVDEPDVVKNDGKYAYILSGDKLTIIDAYPANNASIVSKMGLDIQQGQSLQNMFLQNNTIVVFYQEYAQVSEIPQYDYQPQQISRPLTHVAFIDVTDKTSPKIVQNYQVSGTYTDSRLVNHFVYLITQTTIDDYRHPWIPRVMSSSHLVAMPPIYYFDNPEQYYAFNTITSIDVTSNTPKGIASQTFMMDPSSTIYASQNNIYIAYQRNNQFGYIQPASTDQRDRFFQAIVPLLPTQVQDKIKAIDENNSNSSPDRWDKISSLLQQTYNGMNSEDRDALFSKIEKSLLDYDMKVTISAESTVIHKISISENGTIGYVARGEVPGRLLNQFSMDENNETFRVATTSDNYLPYEGTSEQHNNVYVLDSSMNVTGKLENIAQGESIYAARFIADRLYLVTYQSVDPFFVIDLSSGTPKILGAMSLQGYSDYLQPYDATHIIGIGRETSESTYGQVINGGLKIALFDVSDVANPKLVDSYQIGDASAYSEVLSEHKALLFDKGKNLLVIPVTIPGGSPGPEANNIPVRPQQEWRGFYVFGLDSKLGINLTGKIDHTAQAGNLNFGSYYGYGSSRSFYIDNTLYTITIGNQFKANSLPDLQETSTISLDSGGQLVPYPSTEPPKPAP